jgi:hypothetical protein
MEIDRQNPASLKSRHDIIYTVLLGIVVIKSIFALLQVVSTRSRLPIVAKERAWLPETILFLSIWLFLLLAVLVIRLKFPPYRRWPTLLLNLIFLPFIPWGTALAVYGFWKVDKKMR